MVSRLAPEWLWQVLVPCHPGGVTERADTGEGALQEAEGLLQGLQGLLCCWECQIRADQRFLRVPRAVPAAAGRH